MLVMQFVREMVFLVFVKKAVVTMMLMKMMTKTKVQIMSQNLVKRKRRCLGRLRPCMLVRG